MSSNDFFALTPLLVLAGSSVLIMLLIALKLNHRSIQFSSLILFSIAFAALFNIQKVLPCPIQPLFIIDGFSVFVMGLIIFSSLVVNILSYVYFEEKEENPKEYYILLFLCTLGACILAISKHFISLFLGLEILTVGLYALIAYLRTRHHNIEAGIKYLVLAAFSSAFLLFGMALIYLETGSMDFSAIASNISMLKSLSPLFLTGLGMMLVGIGFKLAVVPFHMWAADIYQGSPTPVTAFISTASKGGVLAVLLRFFVMIDGYRFKVFLLTLISIAIATMIIGNLLALQQKNVKRILAYSSIAHLGYILVALVPGSSLGIQALCFYLITYFITTLIAFGVITILSNKETDAEDIESYRALFWRHPVLACIFSMALLSLAGIPLTAGFVGKFYILAAGLQNGFLIATLVLVISSVIGLYYYLRIITAMFTKQQSILSEEKNTHPAFYITGILILSMLTFLIVWLGVYPSGLMNSIIDFKIK
ncbi:MAG: NADH-quinone oxidoreductase subunit N [Candidatus Pedobacter colombiensis]|uniref:NADH-quinone oxidoreductase subunit N n=1 Tax=Candidatus Pedobacter colombiensis TaxID=3121371 RepID=A0AAJ6B891_9SPHI|nr:NADH-quinone oxidoreductase subunit N [Pedobacter sp.]WEK21150.1 MAG: NADH-quinone oxidoreductase subunit N [Pedobacter sp.]